MPEGKRTDLKGLACLHSTSSPHSKWYRAPENLRRSRGAGSRGRTWHLMPWLDVCLGSEPVDLAWAYGSGRKRAGKNFQSEGWWCSCLILPLFGYQRCVSFFCTTTRLPLSHPMLCQVGRRTPAARGSEVPSGCESWRVGGRGSERRQENSCLYPTKLGLFNTTIPWDDNGSFGWGQGFLQFTQNSVNEMLSTATRMHNLKVENHVLFGGQNWGLKPRTQLLG